MLSAGQPTTLSRYLAFRYWHLSCLIQYSVVFVFSIGVVELSCTVPCLVLSVHTISNAMRGTGQIYCRITRVSVCVHVNITVRLR